MSILFRSEEDEIPQHTREAMDSLLNTISDLQKSNKALHASLQEAYEEGWMDGANACTDQGYLNKCHMNYHIKEDWDKSLTKKSL